MPGTRTTRRAARTAPVLLAIGASTALANRVGDEKIEACRVWGDPNGFNYVSCTANGWVCTDVYWGNQTIHRQCKLA